ncbi:MAG TPA: hypothetical protein VND20_01595 [Candidatus Binataceae bacterium]|nr:hypothetical protein [Candidatus Binataceae bacterium]
MVVGLAGFAAAQQSTPPWLPGAVPRFTVIRHPGLNVDDALSQSLAGTTIPLWNGALPSPSNGYSFVMVGTDPAAGSVSTTVPTVVVPLIFKFHDIDGIHRLSPTVRACGVKYSAVSLTRKSPIFQSFAFTAGGTALGTTQYLDAFQRANFWSDVSTTSPNYHVLLSKTGQTLAVMVDVPTIDGSSIAGPCARIGEVDINWFDNTIVPALLLKMKALKPTVFPIFFSYNVFLTESGSCCVLGYHSEIVNTKGTQTYAYAAFADPHIFSAAAVQDIDPLSHEVGEWMDDPLVQTDLNSTPPWGNLGQVSGCQNNLEVGDPLSGTGFTITNPANNFTYHPQDLAFAPWFAQGISSSSVNGWYDFTNQFATSAAPCPPGGP